MPTERCPLKEINKERITRCVVQASNDSTVIFRYIIKINDENVTIWCPIWKFFLVVVNYLVKVQEREKNQKVNLVLFKDKAWKHTANIIKNCNKMLIDHLKLEMKWWRVTRFAQPRYWYLWCREPFCSPWIKLQHENTLTIYLIYSLYMYY